MRLAEISRGQFPLWKSMCASLYTGVDSIFHDQDMQWIDASGDKAAFFVSADDNEVIGFIELSVRNVVDGCIGDRIGYIEGLYIRPGYRGRGMGRGIVNEAIQWFRAQKCTDVATDTELENSDAQAFFRHIGFQETWRIVQYKKNLNET